MRFFLPQRTQRAQRAITFILSMLSVFSVANSCFAQSDNNATEPKPPRFQWSLSIVNRTGYRIDEPRVLQMSRFFVNGKGIYKFSDNWRLTMEGRVHYDPVERLGHPKRPSFDLRQLLIDGKIGRVSLSLGLQQTVWGQADGLR